MRTYQIINTYDRRFAEHYGENVCVLPNHSPANVRAMADARDNSYRLPNVPVPAKETYLAEALRRGHFMPSSLSRKKTFAKMALKEQRTVAAERHEKNRQRREEARATKFKALENVNVREVSWLRGRLIGLEIEYYPDGRRKPLPDRLPGNPLVRIGNDGSLDSGGREIRKITWQDESGRLGGLGCLPLSGGHVDEKCGLHVHVDMRHLPTSEHAGAAYDLVCLHYPFLQALVPQIRHTNRFCNWVNNRPGSAWFCGSPERYAACNWAAYQEHGTIEFRCQAGSVNLKEIEHWALLCQWLANYCAVSDYIAETWDRFCKLIPLPLRSWVMAHNRKLYSKSFNSWPANRVVWQGQEDPDIDRDGPPF